MFTINSNSITERNIESPTCNLYFLDTHNSIKPEHSVRCIKKEQCISKRLYPKLKDPRSYYIIKYNDYEWCLIKGYPIKYNNKFYSELCANYLTNGEWHVYNTLEKCEVYNHVGDPMITWDWEELEKIAQSLQPYSFKRIGSI